MQIPLGMAWDARPSGAQELPAETARQGLTQGVRLCSPSSPQAPGTMEMLPDPAGAESSPRRESMTNHSLLCKETTDQQTACAK